MKPENAILDEAWRALRARVIAHGMREFTETGRLEAVVDLSVREIDPRRARIAVTLSSGAVICEEFDLFSAALQGFDVSTLNCFGSAARPN